MIKKAIKDNWIAILYYLFIFGVVTVMLIISFRGCKAGTDPKDYKILCINGHAYYHINFMQKTSMAIVLDENGKPVPCED